MLLLGLLQDARHHLGVGPELAPQGHAAGDIGAVLGAAAVILNAHSQRGVVLQVLHHLRTRVEVRRQDGFIMVAHAQLAHVAHRPVPGVLAPYLGHVVG